MKRILMVVFHFPPFAGSSGVQRTLRFVQHLPRFGWEPLVLTAHPRAYQWRSTDLVDEVPVGTVVQRAFALDAAKHLSICKRYPGFLARPDRWVVWRMGALLPGLQLIRRLRPSVIWTTYPIATAHMIGADLHRISGVPWVADFRDPMAQEGYPADVATWNSYKAIEDRALHSAARSVFTTPGAASLYANRYPEVAHRLAVIQNGYDEDSFAGLETEAQRPPLVPGKITLLHSGVIYPSERDPTQFFAALSALCRAGHVMADRLQVRLRAPGDEEFIRALVAKYDLVPVVEILPPIAYREALQEMLRADGLLVLQASSCNEQIPAKLYEYLRTRRPILALTDPVGDTAGVLREAGYGTIANLDSAAAISAALVAFLQQLRAGSTAVPNSRYVAGASRLARAQQLAELLERVI